MKQKTEIEKARELWVDYGWILIADLFLLNLIYWTYLL